ncbi:MAG: hypothetical protein HZB86_05200 [Deltaproteobacteria bacterium]|nr:hypothetical protein [Deltaproteobacteria bacterium]
MHARLIIALLPIALLACAAGPVRATGSAADGTDPARAVAELLTPPLAVCPDRVWPGIPGREFQVLLVDPAGRRALLWNDLRDGYRGSPRISAVPFDTMPPLFTSGSEFQFGELFGHSTLGFSFDPKEDPLWSVEVIVHEAFHRYVQGKWNGAGAEMARGIRYPEPWKPRYLRREMIRSLRAAAEGDAGALAIAAAWMRHLRDEFPGAIRETRRIDAMEGTAEYAGVMAASAAEAGCDADESKLTAAAVRRIRGRWSRPDKEEESYALGGMAGVALRARGTPGWERAAADGVPPAEILLSPVAPGDPPEDNELARATEALYAAANRAIGEKLAPLLSHLAGDREYRVAVPSGWMTGSFATSGFVTVPEGGRERTFTLEMTASFASSGGGSTLSVSEVTTETGPSPCGPGPFHAFLLPRRSLREDAHGRGEITAGPVRGENLSFEIVPDAGTDWLCVR